MINILGDSSQRHYLRKDNCGNYVKTQKILEIVKITGKYLHNEEFEELFQENNVSCKSFYVPGKTNAITTGKSVLIGACIKSLDPPCLGKASPFGSYPGLSRLILGKSRLGVCGFRKSYASKSETKTKSEELNAENVSLKKENRSLR